ncbi:Protein RTA1 [Paramyrothecium foliicola]|nr:Protein RTA1 [Paramyrothecium foliicola]
MANDLFERADPKPFRGDFYLWKYVPSMAAAVIFIVLFLILSLAHTWKMIKMHMWFCLPFVIGGYSKASSITVSGPRILTFVTLVEVVGFAGRAAAVDATDQLMPYIIQSVFTLIPPSLFAASIYMTLGRIIRGLGSRAESLSIIRVAWLTKLFVIGDVFAFLIQSTGAGMMAAGDNPKPGEAAVIVGLIIQILFFGLFVVAAVIFHRRFISYSISAGASPMNDFGWEAMMNMLYATSGLILVRCIFRVIEYIGGSDGYLLSNEWPLYIFDAVLMVITMGIFYWWYPSNVQQAKRLGSESSVGFNMN